LNDGMPNLLDSSLTATLATPRRQAACGAGLRGVGAYPRHDWW
jgi:hypothetical protein